MATATNQPPILDARQGKQPRRAKQPQSETALVVAAPTPIELLRIAVSQNADIDKLKQLMDLQERWEKNEARKAYVAAMSAFKAHAIVVVRDKVNPQYNSKYVSLGRLIETVTPFLSQHDLSAQWDLDQTSGIKVTCIIRHIAGHSESVSMVCPPDKSGSKNPIQEIKSAITYARACTFESICGLATTDVATQDDDGNGTSNGNLSEQVEWIGNACNIDELRKLFEAAYKMFAGNPDAQRVLIQAKDARKKAL